MSKLCLGTVQFGLDYGINNAGGQVKKDDVADILDVARENGIVYYDTAAAYGNAEKVIGEYIAGRKNTENMRILTKMLPMNHVDRRDDLEDNLIKHAKISLERLGLDKVYGYYLHSSKDIYDKNIVEQLRAIKEMGLTDKIGVSSYSLEDIDYTLELGCFDIIQVPYNILDQRFASGYFEEKLVSQSIEVYGRSPFLQGLLLMSPEKVPDYLSNAIPYIKLVQGIVEEYELDIVKLCIQFAVQSKFIHKVLMGVDSIEQLRMNLQVAKWDSDYTEPIALLKQKICHVEDSVILPYLWRV